MKHEFQRRDKRVLRPHQCRGLASCGAMDQFRMLTVMIFRSVSRNRFFEPSLGSRDSTFGKVPTSFRILRLTSAPHSSFFRTNKTHILYLFAKLDKKSHVWAITPSSCHDPSCAHQSRLGPFQRRANPSCISISPSDFSCRVTNLSFRPKRSVSRHPATSVKLPPFNSSSNLSREDSPIDLSSRQ